MQKKQKKLRKKKSSHVIALSDSIKIRTLPAVIGGILLGVICAVLVALIYSLYTFLVSKSAAVGVAVPIILYILLVTASSYVAANYFNIRSFVPSASVGGLFLLMSLTYTVSAYGFAELAGATVPLKLLFTIIGVFLGYFLVDIINLSWLPVREQNDSYFMDDEYDDYSQDYQEQPDTGNERNVYAENSSGWNFDNSFAGNNYNSSYGNFESYNNDAYSGFHQYNDSNANQNDNSNNGY